MPTRLTANEAQAALDIIREMRETRTCSEAYRDLRAVLDGLLAGTDREPPAAKGGDTVVQVTLDGAVLARAVLEHMPDQLARRGA